MYKKIIKYLSFLFMLIPLNCGFEVVNKAKINNFSIQDFTSYELIKAYRHALDLIKTNNIILSSIIFFIGTVVWVLLLGFGSPVFLVGGFIFGKWLGTFLVVFGLSSGATLLYVFANFFCTVLVYHFYAILI